jgi:dihydrofolate synthase / folylpolyglutamate synthase
MIIKPYKTHKIKVGEDLFKILDKYLPHIEEKTIVVITSKIISLSQGNILKHDGHIEKKEMIINEADYYFEDSQLTRFGLVIPTIKDGILIANAGIDESNADGNFVLWPKNLQDITNKIWEYLRKKNNIKNLGIIITDSHLTPLRFGLTGLGISWCGFESLLDYRGTKDIFDREIKMSQLSVIDGLAGATGVVIGEGSEQTPLATITDLAFVNFQNHPPTDEEIQKLKIEKEDDIYGKLLTSVKWIKGGKGTKK